MAGGGGSEDNRAGFAGEREPQNRKRGAGDQRTGETGETWPSARRESALHASMTGCGPVTSNFIAYSFCDSLESVAMRSAGDEGREKERGGEPENIAHGHALYVSFRSSRRGLRRAVAAATRLRSQQMRTIWCSRRAR